MGNESLLDLVVGIIKAIVVFLLRLILLIPMLLLTLIMAVVGSNEKSIGEALFMCICHPFKAFFDAIRDILYEIKEYRNR